MIFVTVFSFILFSIISCGFCF